MATKGKRGPRLPQALVDEMYALHLGGMNLAEIGERFGRTAATIRDLFLARGLEIHRQPRRPYRKSLRPRSPRKSHNRVPDELVAQMHALYVSGLSVVEVGERFSRHAASVAGIFKNRGLEYPIKRRQKRQKRIKADEVAAMHSYYIEGRTLSEVGRKFGRSGKQVGHLFRDRGLVVREVGRPPRAGRRADGTFGLYTPATEEVIEAAISSATRVAIPDHLRLDWRKWSMERRGEFIRRIRERLDSPDDRPLADFSANVTPFDYTTPEARAIAEAEAITAGRSASRICPSKIKLSSQGVIWNGTLWFWVARTGYVAGSWEPGKGRPALHRLIWEHANARPIPQGWCVRHADGNPNNLDPANLQLIDRNTLARENQANALFRKSRERTALLLAMSRNNSSNQKHANTVKSIGTRKG